MWVHTTPPAVLVGAVALSLLTTSVNAKPFPVEDARQLQNATELERRQQVCPQGSTACGWYGQICCTSSQTCSENAAGEAICIAGATAESNGGNNGQWTVFTSYYTATDLVTRTSVFSSYIGGAPAGSTPQPTASCGASQTQCSSVCCDEGYHCDKPGVCKPGASGIVNPSAPLRPTSSTLIVITATGSPTTTLPFSTPIATGAAGEPIEMEGGGGGLSGGAIAGIVIGVIVGIILLLLICFYCCAKAAFDSVLALIGLGGKRRRKHEESTYIEEHHHHGGSAAAGGGRWYGQGSSRPSRPPKEKKGGMGNLLGVGAGLAGLAAVLGMKRKHDQRHDEKSNISSSYYSYSDYTSASSASSDDRRTRNTRHSSRR
ncbi:unnamed protein product [Periconia digitata]|uniref:Uncharacterized protein n=1 Tax=Periconia digitata TaxID=1303443 RepID=A0A9W4U707_9PLEO|nr:unnamed protein product [Periconia digitata]